MLSFVVGALLRVGGLGTIKTAMGIGALPFSLVMVLMCLSLVKAEIRDASRDGHGVQTGHVQH